MRTTSSASFAWIVLFRKNKRAVILPAIAIDCRSRSFDLGRRRCRSSPKRIQRIRFRSFRRRSHCARTRRFRRTSQRASRSPSCFMQSVHYATWLVWIPQDSLPGEGTFTFRMTARSLVSDFGIVCARHFRAARSSHFSDPRSSTRALQSARTCHSQTFHGYFEIAILAYFIGSRTRVTRKAQRDIRATKFSGSTSSRSPSIVEALVAFPMLGATDASIRAPRRLRSSSRISPRTRSYFFSWARVIPRSHHDDDRRRVVGSARGDRRLRVRSFRNLKWSRALAVSALANAASFILGTIATRHASTRLKKIRVRRFSSVSARDFDRRWWGSSVRDCPPESYGLNRVAIFSAAQNACVLVARGNTAHARAMQEHAVRARREKVGSRRSLRCRSRDPNSRARRPFLYSARILEPFSGHFGAISSLLVRSWTELLRPERAVDASEIFVERSCKRCRTRNAPRDLRFRISICSANPDRPKARVPFRSRSPSPSAMIFSASSIVPIFPAATTGVLKPRVAQRGADRFRNVEIRAIRIIVSGHAAVARITGVRIKRLAFDDACVFEFAASRK